MVTDSTGDGSIHAKRYPEEVKELAYQVWAFAAGRDAKRTHASLTAGEHGDPVEVSYQAIAYWAREYAWASRAERDMQSIAPDLRYQAFSELMFAGLDGARYIRQVNAGAIDPDKLRLTSSIAAVDRIGFSPVSKGVPSLDPPSDTTPALPDFASMSEDELRAYDDQVRKQTKRQTITART